MRKIWVAACLAIILLIGQAAVADQTQKVEGTEKKAEVLEKNAARGQQSAAYSIRDHQED